MAQHGQPELHQEELQTVAGRQEHAGDGQKGIKKERQYTETDLYLSYFVSTNKRTDANLQHR